MVLSIAPETFQALIVCISQWYCELLSLAVSPLQVRILTPKEVKETFQPLESVSISLLYLFWYPPSDTVHSSDSELWASVAVGQCWRRFGLSWQSRHLNTTARCQPWHPLLASFAPHCVAFPIWSFFCPFPIQRLSSRNPVLLCLHPGTVPLPAPHGQVLLWPWPILLGPSSRISSYVPLAAHIRRTAVNFSLSYS